jgi:CheY-like chemotaxis protein/anti-sigma regulatory factor (Ser/Thr protein kinase)
VVDLRAVVKAAVDAVGPAAIAKGVRLLGNFADEQDFKLQGDAARLQQVVSNLLSNAVKFTPSGGEVIVRLRRTDGEAQIAVSDTGRGISPDFIPHVFERFRQADGSTTRQHGGLGLGLAIVKHLVELHGGKVSAQSEGENRGATFIVDLPVTAPVIAPNPRGEQNAAAFPRVSLKDISVLLVEDDRDACEVVQRILQLSGARVHCEPSAAAGLEQLREKHFDVLISDIGMPDMDGYGLIRRLREAETTTGRNTPAIALTAFANKDDRDEALRAGYQMHLAKPVSADELTRAVEMLARGKSTVAS